VSTTERNVKTLPMIYNTLIINPHHPMHPPFKFPVEKGAERKCAWRKGVDKKG